MVNEAEDQKISIILVLSVAILTAMLVTGTAVNIVSAANTINVKTKANQHPVKSTGSPHIVSSAHTYGINVQNMTKYHEHPVKVAVCSAGVQPKYRTMCSHAASSARAHGIGQCYTVDIIDGSGSLPTPSPRPVNCPAKFSDVWIRPGPAPVFDLGGKLRGCVGLAQSGLPWQRSECVLSDYDPIDNAAIEIKGYVGKDKHYSFSPGLVAKTKADGTFDGSFRLCDQPQYSDHSAYLTYYLNIPPKDGGRVKESTIPGPYDEPVSSVAPTFTVPPCGPAPGAHFTDMLVTKTEPEGNFTFSGKLVDNDGQPMGNVELNGFSARYLDDSPKTGTFHPFDYKQVPPFGENPLKWTKADGTFRGSFMSCRAYLHPPPSWKYDAEFTAHFDRAEGNVRFVTPTNICEPGGHTQPIRSK
jgi:hypothetical protein